MVLVTPPSTGVNDPGQWFTTIIINNVGQVDTLQGDSIAESAQDLLGGKTFSVTSAEARSYDGAGDQNHILGVEDYGYTQDLIEFDDFPGSKVVADAALYVYATFSTTTGDSLWLAVYAAQYEMPDGTFRIMFQPVGVNDLDYLTGSINAVTFDDPVNTINYGTYYVDRDIQSSIVCFARGTLIATPSGEVPIEEFQPGDLVLTRDEGALPIRWIQKRRLDPIDLMLNPNWHPIRIRANALGAGFPRTDLVVSPQHRIMINSRIVSRMAGVNEALVPAKKLLTLDGVDVMDNVTEVEYWHFLFDSHQIVTSNGLPTESLFTGPQAMTALSQDALTELRELMPEAFSETADDPPAPLARKVFEPGKIGKLLERHRKNNKPLVQGFECQIVSVSFSPQLIDQLK